jgi:hypothetical protein
MNCQSCNTRIEYHYLTSCPHCGCAIEGADPSPLPPLPEPPPLESFRKRLKWKHHVVNFGYLIFSASSFMVAGAVVVWVVVGFATKLIIDIVDPVQTPGEYCGFGMAVGFLSVIGGAFLGTIGGSVLAVKHPLYRH